MIGKILGGLFGFLLTGNFFGLLLGIFIGHFFDRGLAQVFSHAHLFRGKNSEAQQSFFKITFQVMGYIAKSDGVVTEAELDQARHIMRRLNLNETQRKAAIEAFNAGKQPSFNLDEAIAELKLKCHRNHLLLQLFLEFQISAATINHQLTSEKEGIIKRISHALGFASQSQQSFNFESFFNSFNEYAQQQRGGTGGRSGYQQGNPFKSEMSLDSAYQVLGLTSSASNEEVKKTYRKLISQNHPDKLVAKGLPPEMIKLATEKTQKIQLSYERICRARGMS